jgi:hypothetical protein
MTKKESVLTSLTKSLRYLKNVPDGTYFNFAWDGGLQIEATTQEDVRTIRRIFRGGVWKKNYVEYSQQWEYTTKTRSGVNVRIYGVKEGPAQCKMVEETVMEEREVPAAPITYVKKMVEVKKVRYICPDGNKVRS